MLCISLTTRRCCYSAGAGGSVSADGTYGLCMVTVLRFVVARILHCARLLSLAILTRVNDTGKLAHGSSCLLLLFSFITVIVISDTGACFPTIGEAVRAVQKQPAESSLHLDYFKLTVADLMI